MAETRPENEGRLYAQIFACIHTLPWTLSSAFILDIKFTPENLLIIFRHLYLPETKNIC